MRQTITRVIDDVSTVAFGLDGKGYEIDLSDDHAADLREALDPYVAAARPVSGPRPPARPARKVAAPARTDRGQAQAMREWARSHGMYCSDRGRIPQQVQDAYHGQAS